MAEDPKALFLPCGLLLFLGNGVSWLLGWGWGVSQALGGGWTGSTARLGFLLSSSFRREVLASEAVLGMPSRADWRSCQAGREEEAAAAQEFSQAFAPFDPAEMD